MSVTVKEVTKLYGSQKALDHVSFEIKTGEIVALLGPNGAGKSTMMKIITGCIPASSGTVTINGENVDTDNLNNKAQTGYLPENNPLYPGMYVREYLKFVTSFYRKKNISCISIDDIVDITGLTGEQNKKIGMLSKGYRQRVGLAQALIHNPKILILDEATTGLDPNQIIEIRNLILEAGKEKTILLSTHIMQEVNAICDRILIINKGRLIADEKKEAIYSKVSHPQQVVSVEFDKTVTGSDLMTFIPNIQAADLMKNGTWCIIANNNEDIRPDIFSFAVKNNLTVLSMSREETNLEEVFKELTQQ